MPASQPPNLLFLITDQQRADTLAPGSLCQTPNLQRLAARGIRLIAEEEVQPWRWDIVVEATGSPGGFELARKAIRPRGTLVMKSTYKGEMSVNFSSIVVDEVNIVGSRCGPFEPALRLMESKQVDPTVLIDSEFTLGEALKAFEHAAETGVLKVLVQP